MKERRFPFLRASIVSGLTAFVVGLACATAPEPAPAPPLVKDKADDAQQILRECQDRMKNRDVINTLYDADKMYAYLHAQRGVDALPNILQDEVKRVNQQVKKGAYRRENVMTDKGVLQIGGYLTPYFRDPTPDVLPCLVVNLAKNRDAPNQCKEIPEDLALYNTCAMESMAKLGIFPEVADDLKLLKSLRQPERKEIRYDNAADPK